MWPWEHVIVGYVAYSLFRHLFFQQSPTGRETLAVVFASLLPDLIDKPLAWQFGVFEGGYALGHSVFFAVPVSIVVGVLAWRFGAGRAGLAFAVSYLVHLPSDVVSPYFDYGDLAWERILWPVRKSEGEYSQGLIDGFLEFFIPYLYELAAGDPSGYLLFQLSLMGCAFLLWVYDGMPVLREAVLGTHRRMTGGGGL